MAEVLVVAEHREGKLHDAALEAMALGQQVAEATGGHATVALLGHRLGELAKDIASHGLAVLQVEGEALAPYTPEGYAEALRGLLGEENPALVLAAHTATGYEFLPRFAGEANLPIVTDCVDLRLQDGTLVAHRSIFNGKVVAEVEVAGPGPFVATLRPATVKPLARAAHPGAIRTVQAKVDPSCIRRKVLGVERPETGDVDLSQAEVIVAVGRGIKEKQNLKLIEDFAKVVGGVVAGSRPLIDKEWLPWSRQVGSSGRTVKPKLYIACGISGATQHISGIKGSEIIIAINTDPTAPIFDVATFGVVGDLFKVIPLTIKELKGG